MEAANVLSSNPAPGHEVFACMHSCLLADVNTSSDVSGTCYIIVCQRCTTPELLHMPRMVQEVDQLFICRQMTDC